MNRLQMSQLGRVARCSACGARHWRPAAAAPGANLHGATWQQWHADSLAAGAPVVCELCHWWSGQQNLRAGLLGLLLSDMAAELVA